MIRGSGYGWNLIVQRVSGTGRANPKWIAATDGEPEIRIGEFTTKFEGLDAAEAWAKANRRDRNE